MKIKNYILIVFLALVRERCMTIHNCVKKIKRKTLSQYSLHLIQSFLTFLPKRKKLFGVVCLCDSRTSLMRNKSMSFFMCLYISITIDGISCFIHRAVCGLRKNVTDWSLHERDTIQVTIALDELDSWWTSWMTSKKHWIKNAYRCIWIGDFGRMQIPRGEKCHVMVWLFCLGNAREVRGECVMDVVVLCNLALSGQIKHSRMNVFIASCK